jgi:hypothetical protein
VGYNERLIINIPGVLMTTTLNRQSVISGNKQIHSLLRKAAEEGDIGCFEKTLKDGFITPSTPDGIVATIVELMRDKATVDGFTEKKFSTWVQASSADDDQKGKRLSYLMMSACRLYPHRSRKAANSLLKMGADPYAAFNNETRELGGMRLNMYLRSICPFAYAVDNGHREIVKDMFAANKHKGSDKALVEVGSVCISPPESAIEMAHWEPLNQVGFAIACGQTEMFKAMLSELDCTNPKIQQKLGETVHSLLKIGLLDQGPDSVLGNIVTLIGRGANIKPFANELFSKWVSVDNGLDFARKPPSDKLAFPAMVMLSTDYLPGASNSDAVAAVNAMFKAGLDVDMEVNPSRSGARMMHYAAMGGSTSLANALLANGATGLEKDVLGKRPIDYVDIADPREDMKRLLSGSAANEFLKDADGPAPESKVRGKASTNASAPVSADRQDKFARLKARHNALRQ